MSQDRKGSGSAATKQDDEDVFDAKTVIRANPNRPPPTGRESSLSEDTPVPASPQSFGDPFEERTRVAPKQQPRPEPTKVETPKASQVHAPGPVNRPPPKPVVKLQSEDQSSWDIRQEDTHPGLKEGLPIDALKLDDRKRLIIKGAAVFVAVILVVFIARRFGKGGSEGSALEQESVKSTAEATAGAVKTKTGAQSGNNSVPSTVKGTMENLMQEFDHAFFSTQSQTR